MRSKTLDVYLVVLLKLLGVVLTEARSFLYPPLRKNSNIHEDNKEEILLKIWKIE